jgi:hypothetical protein
MPCGFWICSEGLRRYVAETRGFWPLTIKLPQVFRNAGGRKL